MIVIVDFGMGNLQSIFNAFHKIQVDARIASDPATVLRADRLVLPGVGAFDAAMQNLRAGTLVPVLEDKVLRDGVPTLGICLGLHIFTRRSDEGQEPGLGWLDAETVSFSANPDVAPAFKVPHMGWNSISIRGACPLLTGVPVGTSFYFAHSYHLRCGDPTLTVAQADYGSAFPAVIRHRNIYGTQFHPEKSLSAGLQLLRNFAERT